MDNDEPKLHIDSDKPKVMYYSQDQMDKVWAEALKEAAKNADVCLAGQGFENERYGLRGFVRISILGSEEALKVFEWGVSQSIADKQEGV